MRDEGPRFVFRGWTPAFVRLGPNTVLLFVFFEVCHSDLRKVSAPYFSFLKATQDRVGCYGAQTLMTPVKKLN
jgi:Mitochondrial carrier protein